MSLRLSIQIFRPGSRLTKRQKNVFVFSCLDPHQETFGNLDPFQNDWKQIACYWTEGIIDTGASVQAACSAQGMHSSTYFNVFLLEL